MSKSAALLLILVLLTASSVFMFLPVKAGTMADNLTINVVSPLQKQVYYSSDLLLSFYVTKPSSWSEVFSGYSGGILYDWVGFIHFAGYNLDGKESENVTVDDHQGGLTIGPKPAKVFDFSFNLTELSEGLHNVTVSVFGSYKEDTFVYSRSVIFFVDTVPLELKIVSPENRVYNVSGLPLNFTVDEPVSQISYSLDGQTNVTIIGNITLESLPYGEHNVTVYATDNVGNIGSKTVFFTIMEPSKPFPTTLVVASAIIVAVVGIGLLFYFKKRKH